MVDVTAAYEGHVFARRVVGAGPYFGQYRFVVDHPAEAVWVRLLKSWPTEQLALDDAIRAAHFAVDVENYGGAVIRAVEASTLVMTLSGESPSWPAAAQAKRVAENERDVLEARLLGAKERHWPDVQVRSGRAPLFRCQ